jgi:hypothetical protein
VSSEGYIVYDNTALLQPSDVQPLHADAYNEPLHLRLSSLEAGNYVVKFEVHDAITFWERSSSRLILDLHQFGGEYEDYLLCKYDRKLHVVSSIDTLQSVPHPVIRDTASHHHDTASQHAPRVETVRLGSTQKQKENGIGGEGSKETAAASVVSASVVSVVYVLNVPGEDDRWQRMLSVLDESVAPGPRVHRFDTVSLTDYRILEYSPSLVDVTETGGNPISGADSISWAQRYSNLLTHVEVWEHFSTDTDADADSWALVFEDDIVVHPDLRGQRALIEAQLAQGFALGTREGFVYLGLCGFKSGELVQSDPEQHVSAPSAPHTHGVLAHEWQEVHGPHGSLYLHKPTNTYTAYPPGDAGAGGGVPPPLSVYTAHGVEFVKGCGTCLHAYGVTKWRAASLWSQIESIPWPPGHPLTEPPDAVTLDAYLFHAMNSRVLPMVWCIGCNLTYRGAGYRGIMHQDAELPGGILY